jgi:hypothetical protein
MRVFREHGHRRNRHLLVSTLAGRTDLKSHQQPDGKQHEQQRCHSHTKRVLLVVSLPPLALLAPDSKFEASSFEVAA